jgi:branched-chain amino acid transport system ATP-binding protein
MTTMTGPGQIDTAAPDPGSAKQPPAPSMSGRLQAHAISVQFDGLRAIADVDFELAGNEVLGLIGPNGAGKTTLVNVLSGFQRPNSGRILLDSVDVTRWPPRRLTHAGISRTFQNVRLFQELTVLENLEVGGVTLGKSRALARARGLEILDWLHLGDKAHVRAGTLAYGEERMAGVARALSTTPRFLMLDEPAAGMNEAECEELMGLIGRIPQAFGCGVLVIEHNMRVVMGVCSRIHVIATGSTIAVGTPAEIQSNRTVVDAYLGERKMKA